MGQFKWNKVRQPQSHLNNATCCKMNKSSKEYKQPEVIFYLDEMAFQAVAKLEDTETLGVRFTRENGMIKGTLLQVSNSNHSPNEAHGASMSTAASAVPHQCVARKVIPSRHDTSVDGQNETSEDTTDSLDTLGPLPVSMSKKESKAVPFEVESDEEEVDFSQKNELAYLCLDEP